MRRSLSRLLRFWRVGLAGILLLAACTRGRNTEAGQTAWVRDSAHDASAAVTADSLFSLVPSRELEAAIARGDLRPIGVCGFACMTVGIEPADIALVPTDSMIIVPGTGDAISGPGMFRLNAVADTFATRYNRLLIEHLKARQAPRAPGQG